jgi:hypothetical protein
MKPFLMGAETEFAVSGRSLGSPINASVLFRRLASELRKGHATVTDVVTSDGFYLDNGGRLYLDYGEHPEYATPECHTPAEVALYDKAGERLLANAKRTLQAQDASLQVTILKNNLNACYPDDITWGTHESYTSWVGPHDAAGAVLPHLATRIIYAGSGCLSATPMGKGFELSQRARHMHRPVGSDTTSDRPLFCMRVRKASDSSGEGWTRAHLISKDSQRSPFGVYLTYGVTGLLFVLLNEGIPVGRGMALEDPIRAMRQVSCDPWLKQTVGLADGRSMTALDIQQCYLAECTSAVENGDFPDWTREVVRHWGETLATLAKDPLRMASKLDPYYKLLVIDHALKRADQTWEGLQEALRDLAEIRSEGSLAIQGALLTDDAAHLDGEDCARYSAIYKKHRLYRPANLERLRLAIRLQQFDLAYHEVGGMHDELTASGHLQPVVLTDEDVGRATHEPPAGGRAASRGEQIEKSREPGWVCEWRYLFNTESGAFIDLRDPFSGRGSAATWSRVLTDEGDDPEVAEIAGQIGCHR